MAANNASTAVAAPSPPTVIAPNDDATKEVASKPSYANTHQEQPEKPGFIARTFEDPIAFFTLALVASTVLLWRATLRLASEARESARDSIAEAAKANEIAEKTAHRQLRAYIVVTGLSPVKFAANQVPRFKVEMKNCGQTPALGVHIIARPFWYRPKDGEPPIRFPREPTGVVSRMTLAPDKPHLQDDPGTKEPINFGAADDLNNGKMGCIYAGVIVYRDIFRKRHMTTFKARFDHAAAEGANNFQFCRTGNVVG
jgi:hypothetical protein